MTNAANNNKNSEIEKPRGPGVLKIIQSILAGAFGVQSNKNRQEDFSSHSPAPYIIAGLIFTGLFVGGLISVVNLVLSGQ